MLQFVDRYKQDRKGIKALPKTLKGIQKLLMSDFGLNLYDLSYGIKKGQYLAVSYWNIDEFGHPGITTCPSLLNACSNLYQSIHKSFPEYTRNSLEARQEIIDRFPKQHHKLVKQVLDVFYEIQPDFEINGGDFVPPQLAKEKYERGNPDAFALIVHDGGGVYDWLGYYGDLYNRGDNELYKFLEQYFELEINNNWSTTLYLKEEF